MRKLFYMLGLVLSIVIGGVGLSTTNAFAGSSSDSCSTLGNGDQVCNVTKVASADSNGAIHVVSHNRVTTKGKTLLVFQSKSGYKTSAKCVTVNSFAQGKHHKCFVVSGKMKGDKFANSGLHSGVRVWFTDYVGSVYTPVGSKFYWDAKLHTWRKANCGNFVLHGHPKLPVSKVELVRTLNQLKVHLVATYNKSLSETISATAKCSGNGTSASATVNGSDSLSVQIKVVATASTYAQAVQKANNARKLELGSKADISLQSSVYITAYDNLKGSVSVTCGSTTPPPPTCPPGTTGTPPNCVTPPPPTCPKGETGTPPNCVKPTCPPGETGTPPNCVVPTCPPGEIGTPPNCTTPPPVVHYTQISCTGFEEVFGDEQMTIKCDVSNDNGAPIALSANSNDGNSRVSGINCFSQGGTPSCQGDGTFEFQVTGINNGSSTLYSSVTAVASSNGVTATYNSGAFPVDPIDGGF